MKQIHILKTVKGWTAKCNSASADLISGANKNLVVKEAVGLAKRFYGKAVLFIHGLDGRILEQRDI